MIEDLIKRAWKLFTRYERTLDDVDYHMYLDAREAAEIALSCVHPSRLKFYEILP